MSLSRVSPNNLQVQYIGFFFDARAIVFAILETEMHRGCPFLNHHGHIPCRKISIFNPRSIVFIILFLHVTIHMLLLFKNHYLITLFFLRHFEDIVDAKSVRETRSKKKKRSRRATWRVKRCRVTSLHVMFRHVISENIAR